MARDRGAQRRCLREWIRQQFGTQAALIRRLREVYGQAAPADRSVRRWLSPGGPLPNGASLDCLLGLGLDRGAYLAGAESSASWLQDRIVDAAPVRYRDSVRILTGQPHLIAAGVAANLAQTIEALERKVGGDMATVLVLLTRPNVVNAVFEQTTAVEVSQQFGGTEPVWPTTAL